MDDKQLLALHESMKSSANLGDYNSFKSMIGSDDKYRKAFFDTASMSHDIGDFKTFDNSFKKKGGSTVSATVLPSPFVSETPAQKKTRHGQTFQSDATTLSGNYKSGLDQAFQKRDQFGGIDMFGVSQFQQSREGKAGKIVSEFENSGTATKEDIKYLNSVAPKAATQIVFNGTPEPVKQKIQKTGKIDDADMESFSLNHKSIVEEGILTKTAKFYSDKNKNLVSTLTGIPGFDPSMVSDPKYLNNFYKSITATKTQELAALETSFPVKVIPSGIASITVRENGKEYEARLKEIDDRYAKTYDAVGRLAASKIATPDKDPLEIGLEYLKFADPSKYSVRVKAGSSGIDRDIAAVGSQLQYANTSDLRQLKNVKIVSDNLDTRFPEKLVAETRRRLGAELYKGDNWFLNFSPSVEELDKAAAQLPEKNKEAYFKLIREEESKIIGTDIPQSGALNQLGMGMMSTVEGTNNYLASKIGVRGESDIAKDALNAPNKTRFEAAGAGQAEMTRIKELNNKVKSGSTLTVDELEEKRDLESFTNIRSTGQKVIDGSFNLAGQVLFQALGTKGLAGLGSAVVKGAGLLKTAMPVGLATEEAIASSAMNFGISQSQIANVAGAMVAYSSSYDGAAQEAIQLFPDDNNKRAIYTTAVAGLNAVTERIFKDEKILDAFKRTVRPNIGNLVNEIAAGRLTKELLQPTLTKIINDGFKIVGLSTIENVKETTEEVATSVGTSLTKLLLAPEKFNYSEAVDDAVTTATTMFTDGGLVALVAGVKGYRQNKVGIGVLSKLGVDKTFTADVKSVINAQILSGDITKEEADKKLNVINKIVETNTIDMPKVNALAKISATASKKYSIALANEKLLKQEYDTSNDEALKSKIQSDIKASENIRKSILNKEVFIDDNYAVVTPAEASQSSLAPELSNIERLTPEQIEVTGDAAEFANQMGAAQSSLGRGGMSVSPYAQEDYDQIASEGGKFLRAAGNKILALLKPNGEMVSLVKDATVKTKGAAQAMISKMKDMGGLFMDNYDIYLTPIYEKAGYRVAARVPFNEEYAPEGWDAEDSPLKNKPDVVFMVRNDFAPAQDQTFTDYEEAQRYTQGLVDNAVAQGVAKLPSEASAIDTALNQAIPNATRSLEKAGIRFQVVDGATDTDAAKAARGNQALFLSDDGTIIIDRSKLQNDIEAGLVVWHEASHPVMNIIRNTNKPLYDAVVRGLNQASQNNKGVADALNWAQSQEQYDNADTQNDEAIVETIGRINSGLIDVSSLDTGLRQQIIDFVNSIAKYFGIDPILNDTDIAAFKKTVSEVADALKTGRDIAEVVGEDNVSQTQAPAIQARANEVFDGILDKIGISFGSVNEKTGSKKVTNFDVASALNKYYKKAFRTLRVDDFGKKALDIVSDYGTDEVIYALAKFGKESGKGWYTEDYGAALTTMQKLDPDILNNPEIKEIATVVIAISSNSTDVATNLTRIIYAIDQYKKNNKIPTDVGTGKAIEAIASGVGRYNRLLQSFGGDVNALKDFLQTIRPVSESKKALIERLGVSSYAKVLEQDLGTNPEWNENEVLPTSVIIFGPKIGAFYSNLSGLGGTPTIDRWCIRTMYRYRGDMKAKVSSSDLEGFVKENGLEGQATGNIVALADAHGKLFTAILTGKGEYKGMSKQERNAALKPYRKGSQISDKLSGVVNDIKDGITDKVENAAKYSRDFRTFTKQAFEEIQKKVQERTGDKLDISDIQAILWIYEKNLFGAMGVKQREDSTYSAAANTLVNKVESGSISLDNLKAGKITNIEAEGVIEEGAMGDKIDVPVESYKEGVDSQPIRANKSVNDQSSVGNRSEDDLRAPGTGKERDRALSSRFGDLDPETQAKISDDAVTYFQKTNKETAKAVEEFIEGRNLVDMADYVLSNPQIPEVSKVWMAAEVANRMNAEIAAAKSAGDTAMVEALTDKQSAIYNDFAKQATSLGQAVQAFIAFKKDPNAVEFFLPKVLKQLKSAGVDNVTDVQKAEIATLLKDVSSAADGLPKDKAIIKLSHYLAGLTPMKPMDILQAIWYAKILSGITTQSTNFFANVFNTVFELPAVGIRIALKTGNPMAVIAGMKGFGSGVLKGAVAAADIAKSGVRSKEVDKYFAESPLEYFTWSKWLGKTGKAMDYIPPINFGAWKYVGRLLAATDALFATANQEAIANMLAYAEAAGMPGNNNFKKANAILGNNKQSISDAKSQATAEGFDLKSIQGRRRVIEIIAQKRGENIATEAGAIGKRITLNYSPEGWTKPLFDAVVGLQKSMPAIKMIIPFARIVANLTENGLNYTPFGLAKAATGIKNPFSGLKSDRLTAYERADLLSKFAIGMGSLAIMATKTGEDDDDWFEITAGGTSDVQKKYELQKGGWRPYTITFKDGTKLSYKDWPIAGLLAGVGHIRDAKKYSYDDSTEMGLYAFGFFQNFYDKSLLAGLQDFFGIFSVTAGRGKYAPETKRSERAMKYAAQQVRSVAVSNMSQQAGKMYSELVTGDPQRDAKTFAEVIYRDLPMFNDGIRPIIDIFGDPVKYNTTERLTPTFSAESDELVKWLNENKLFVGVPMKRNIITSDGTERPMTDGEFYEYRKLAGEQTKGMINEFMEGIKYPDQNIKEKMFDAAKKTARDVAYITILEKYGFK